MRLIIESFGAQVSYDHGMIVVETEEKTSEFSVLHVTSLHLYPSVRISTMAIQKCIEAGIPVFIQNDYQMLAVVWSPHYGSIAKIRQKQMLLTFSNLKYPVIKRILSAKNKNRIRWLTQISKSQAILKHIRKIENFNEQIRQAPEIDQTLRALEGAASKEFFAAFAKLTPPKFQFQKRIQRNPPDPVNAMLNYAYGILYNDITLALIEAGLDPHAGFFHAPQYNRPALTYDFIEPYRPWAEKIVLQTLKQKQIQNIKLIENNLLTTQAKKTLAENFLQWFDQQRIQHNNRIKTPRNHIRIDAQQFSKYIHNLPLRKLFQNIQPENLKE